jgi:hypothetical protein
MGTKNMVTFQMQDYEKEFCTFVAEKNANL